MVEEEKEVKAGQSSALAMFQQNQESYEDAQARAAEESRSFANFNRFEMKKDDTYCIRILPLAPNAEGVLDRKSYEYPFHQMFLKIKNQKTNKDVTIPVVRATYAGHETDLIDTYRKAAISEASEKGDDDLVKAIGEGSFNGGLRYDFKHAMLVLDANNIKDGIKILDLSHSQYKSLEEAKLKLWGKLVKRNPNAPCPISSIFDAYIVEIDRTTEKKKTDYKFTIDTVGETAPLEEADLEALLKMPRIPEAIYKYNRYSLTATIEFLRQYDEKHGLHTMESDEVKEVIAAIEAKLPADDTSEFSFDKKDKKDGAGNNDTNKTYTLTELQDWFDENVKNNFSDKSEEGIELRTAMREFIEANGLDIRLGRTSTNDDILTSIEEALDQSLIRQTLLAPAPDSVKEEDEEGEEAQSSEEETPEETPHTRRSRTARDVEDDEKDGDEEETSATTTRRRR